MDNGWAISINKGIERFNNKIIKLIKEECHKEAEQELIEANEEIIDGCKEIPYDEVHGLTMCIQQAMERLITFYNEKNNGEEDTYQGKREMLISDYLQLLQDLIPELKEKLNPLLPKE